MALPAFRELRIAHVLESFAIGGAERLALDIAATQARGAAKVWAVSLGGDGEPLEGEFRKHGVKTVTMTKNEGVDLVLVARFAAWFIKNRVNIVHTHNPA